MDQAEHERWWRERGASELRELLFNEWDPIGMRHLAEEAPLDEYEHYASEEELASVLEGFRADMGLEPSDEPPRDVARKLRDWYARSVA
jgi:hypothetical protein